MEGYYLNGRRGSSLLQSVQIGGQGSNSPPIQWVPGVLSQGVKWPLCEAAHSPPLGAEIKNEWRLPPLPPSG